MQHAPLSAFSSRSQVLLSQIIRQEPLISENRRPALRQLIHRLIDKMLEQQHHSFTLFKVGREAGGDKEGAAVRGCVAWGTWGPRPRHATRQHSSR